MYMIVYTYAYTSYLCVQTVFLQEYGGLENAPELIKATVVEVEQLTMSEASDSNS